MKKPEAPPRRLIACLDLKDGRVVKGVQFGGLRDQGDPVALAMRHAQDGADEIVLLDIAGTEQSRESTLAVTAQLASQLPVPLTVGGGLRSIEHMEAVLDAGAQRVVVSSAAVANPDLVAQAAHRIGSRRLVVAVDAKRWPAAAENGDAEEISWQVFVAGGRQATGRQAVAWCADLARLGAGEILLTSIDSDGTGQGFDLELVAAAAAATASEDVPIIASGGAGHPEHFLQAFQTGAQAVLAASIFHQQLVPLRAAKAYLQAKGVQVVSPPLLSADPGWLDEIKFDDRGLVPVVVVPAAADGNPAGPPLMLGWADRQALTRCMTTGLLWFWSRSRQQLWQKGETSGHVQAVRKLIPDCDNDAVLATVIGFGPMCHTGADSCFHGNPWSLSSDFSPDGLLAEQWPQQLAKLYKTISQRINDRPEGSYVARLVAAGEEQVRRKVGEEAVEVILAADRQDLVAEMADLWFHSLVLLAQQGIDPAAVSAELARRERPQPGG